MITRDQVKARIRQMIAKADRQIEQELRELARTQAQSCSPRDNRNYPKGSVRAGTPIDMDDSESHVLHRE